METTPDQLVEAIVAACVGSPIGHNLGPDALRIAVNAHRESVIQGREVTLQPMWELFVEQGFAVKDIAPSMCRFKTWETQLGTAIELPQALATLTEQHIRDQAARAPVSDVDLGKVLNKSLRRPSRNTLLRLGEAAVRPARRLTRNTVQGAGTLTRFASKKLTRRRCIVLGGASLAIVIGAFSAFQLLAGPSEEELLPATFAGEIPILKATRVGSQVNAAVDDSNWLRSPDQTRRQALRKALDKLQPLGVESLHLLDSGQTLRATITRPSGGSEQIFFL